MENPFIHGTTSAILPYLIKTNFYLMSPVKLMLENKLAPPCGELIMGGLDNASAKGDVAFGRMIGQNVNQYDLEKVKRYTSISRSGYRTVETELEIARRSSFSNIITLNITLMRNPISKEEFDNIIEDAKLARKALSLILKFDTILKPNNNYSQLERKNISDAVYTFFSFNNLKEKIRNIDLDNHEELEAVLKIEKECIILSGFNCKPTNVILPISRIFTLNGHNSSTISSLEAEYTSYRFSQNLEGYHYPTILEKYYQGCLTSNFWEKLHDHMRKYLIDFDKHLEHMIWIKDNLDCTNKQIIHETYPIIFICEDDSIMLPWNNEYRATRSLKIGDDIKLALTDGEHLNELKQFFSDNNLDCEVKLIS